MKSSNNSFTKSTMTSGAILGASLIIFSFILTISGLANNSGANLLTYVILIGSIIYGIKQVRDRVFEGFISYGNALGAGVLVALFGGVIQGFFLFLQMKYIDPSLMSKALEATQEQWAQSGMSDDKIEMTSNLMQSFMTPEFAAISAVFGFTLMGTIFSLIIAAFMKKEPDIFANNNTTINSTTQNN